MTGRQHRFVDSGDLVRQRIDDGGMYRVYRINQTRESKALSLGHQLKVCATTFEAPEPDLFRHLDPPPVHAKVS
jgi:hypothetical protein